jgi:hypothetical protein
MQSLGFKGLVEASAPRGDGRRNLGDRRSFPPLQKFIKINLKSGARLPMNDLGEFDFKFKRRDSHAGYRHFFCYLEYAALESIPLKQAREANVAGH